MSDENDIARLEQQIAELQARLAQAEAARWEAAQNYSWRYPWGDDWDAGKCNTSEEGPGGTTPVGIYPDGSSPHGLLDASGNVLEWLQSQWKEYPYNPKDGREDLSGDQYRVVRGGSWRYIVRNARCAFRDNILPVNRLDYVGWRCVVVSPGSRR